jgi:hypothetical protein
LNVQQAPPEQEVGLERRISDDLSGGEQSLTCSSYRGKLEATFGLLSLFRPTFDQQIHQIPIPEI